MALAQQTLGLTPTTIFSSTGTTTTTAVYFMNDSAGTVNIQVYLVISGASAGTTNKIMKDLPISAGDTYVLDTERLVLSDGDTIQAQSDVDAVVQCTVSYIGV